MTFRARIQQAIFAVVASTTAAVLVVAQSQNTAAYGEMVDALFQQQMQTFRQAQAQRLQMARQEAGRLADSVRLFAALEEGDPETYKVAADELRLAEFDFFRLSSAQEGLLPPPADSRAGQLTEAAEAALARQLAPLLEVAGSKGEPNKESQTGFFILPAAAEPEAEQMVQVFAVPIHQFESTVGWLLLGQYLRTDPVTRPGSNSGLKMQSALWTGLRLYGQRLPAGLAEALTRKQLPAQPPSAEPHADFVHEAEGNGRFRVHLFRLNPGSSLPPAWLVSMVSMEGLEVRQRELLWKIVGTGVAALLLASLAGAMLAAQLGKPVRELVAATQAVREGNLNIRLERGRTDELAALTESFNEMTAGLALKERYHSVLSMVADARVAEQLMSGSIQLGGELRQVTIMFCDIRGYTALSDGRDPREVIALLNAHMGALTRIVYQHGGVINQFAGDAIMALFGAPSSHGKDTENATRCALEMMAERTRLNATSQQPLRIGIGIATGTVVAGCIGAENRADYTVVGAQVNLAARLCSSAAAGEVVVDSATRQELPPGFCVEALPPLTLKGFAEPVPAFRALSSPAAPDHV